ncbi:MAG: response regulator transcription factor [Acidimicrobiia bacterium]|nr:response regulator transcription factor [Acidimicrobiia bacterium]NNF10365.1 response regulator transcription factor [Acidimicrobiia bacterium]NNL71521.1 response regulator transcription factor [Acidimicrobiia bacterium]
MERPILMIEDEPVFSELVTRTFASEGYEVVVEDTGRGGLEAFARLNPQVVILDLRLPDMSGFDVCRTIRSTSMVPIVILSSQADEMNKVLGLELGADDYATKPFSPRELLARVRAIKRRVGDQTDPQRMIELSGYEIDMARREVRRHGDVIELTAREFDLLRHLVRHIGAAVSRQDLFERVWEQEFMGRSRTVDAHVAAVRKKLPDLSITTLRGIGYRLESA